MIDHCCVPRGTQPRVGQLERKLFHVKHTLITNEPLLLTNHHI